MCELLADKELIEYHDGKLFPVIETEDGEHRELKSSIVEPPEQLPQQFAINANEWPIKIEIKIEIAENVDSKTLQMISSFIKDLKKNEGE